MVRVIKAADYVIFRCDDYLEFIMYAYLVKHQFRMPAQVILAVHKLRKRLVYNYRLPFSIHEEELLIVDESVLYEGAPKCAPQTPEPNPHIRR